MLEYLKKVEKLILHAITYMMVFVIFLSTIRLGWILVEQMFAPPFLLLKADDLLRLFGFFLIILVGIGLLESVKNYLTQEKIQVEVVLTVALVAMVRKVIVMDPSKLDPLVLIGISAIIITLSVGYFLLKKAHKEFNT